MTDSKTVVEDLAAWLTSVWDEEERLATEAAEEEHGAEWDALMYPYEGIAVHTRQMGDYGNRTAVTRHIAYHDPASVLARIAADRKILALHEPTGDGKCRTCCGEPYMEEFWDGETETVEWKRADLAWPCETVLLLASPHADRPGFRPEWLVERQGVEQ